MMGPDRPGSRIIGPGATLIHGATEQNNFRDYSEINMQIFQAFDNRLSAFIIGILAIVCAILSNVHKSVSFTFLTAVAFTLQLVAQFFVIKFAEIYTTHANEVSTKVGMVSYLLPRILKFNNIYDFRKHFKTLIITFVVKLSKVSTKSKNFTIHF